MTDDAPNSTLSVFDAKDAPERAIPRAWLFVVTENGVPRGARHGLAGVDEVSLERATERSVARIASEKKLVIRLADGTMSSKHARLRRDGASWTLEDGPSKNGTRKNGETVERATLADGDVIEVGGTFLVFRANVPTAPGEALDLDATDVRPHAADLATLSPPLSATFDVLPEIARSPLPVLISGETGTGKELIARAVHALSRRKGAFVAVNCAALPETLVESELFGYRRGAFSGANEDRAGLVRSADGGTLFLDEIGELRGPAQAALLRVLQEREVLPLGSAKAIPVDLRVVTATHRDLAAEVKKATFRADLLARVTGFTIQLPPLHERREDLGLLLAALLARAGAPPATTFTREAVRAMLQHAWPHNVRELEHRLAAAVVLARGAPIAREHVFQPSSPMDADPPAADAPPITDPAERARKEEIVRVLGAHDGNVSAAARAMGKARFQLQRWIKRYGIDPAQCRTK